MTSPAVPPAPAHDPERPVLIAQINSVSDQLSKMVAPTEKDERLALTTLLAALHNRVAGIDMAIAAATTHRATQQQKELALAAQQHHHQQQQQHYHQHHLIPPAAAASGRSRSPQSVSARSTPRARSGSITDLPPSIAPSAASGGTPGGSRTPGSRPGSGDPHNRSVNPCNCGWTKGPRRTGVCQECQSSFSVCERCYRYMAGGVRPLWHRSEECERVQNERSEQNNGNRTPEVLGVRQSSAAHF